MFSRKTNGEYLIGLDCGSGWEEFLYFHARLSSENFIDGAPHGLSRAWKGNLFGGISDDIRTTGYFGWVIDALSDECYRVEFRHNFRYFLFVCQKKCCLEKEEGKLSGEIINKGESLANGLPLLYSIPPYRYSVLVTWDQQEMYVLRTYLSGILKVLLVIVNNSPSPTPTFLYTVTLFFFFLFLLIFEVGFGQSELFMQST